MRKTLTITTFLAFIGLSLGSLTAQRFESPLTAKQAWSGYGTAYTHTIMNVPSGAWGTAKLTVYYNGDYGDYSEYVEVYTQTDSLLGSAGPYASGSDCSGLDSAVFYIAADSINAWNVNGSIDFVLYNSGNVDGSECDGFPTSDFTQVKLEFNYCSTGVPTQQASIASIPAFCPLDAPIELIVSPAGGVILGLGVSGAFLNPQEAVNNSYITYVYSDANGCETFDSVKVSVLRPPSIKDNLLACPNVATEFEFSKAGHYVWGDNQALNPIIDSGNVFRVDPLVQSTSFYIAERAVKSSVYNVVLDSNSYAVVDHYNASDDDRGGIAVTPDYIFVVGDDYTVRANASDLSNQVSLPIQDALFSDLNTGNLYSLWSISSNQEPNYGNSNVLVDAIRGLDVDMNFTSDIYPIATPFQVGYGSLILAGSNEVGVISGDNGHFYVISLTDFTVQDLGEAHANYSGSENWAAWGVLENDGANYYALYSNYNSDIVRYDIINDVETSATSFLPNLDLSDLSSFTLSPWNNRWYFHYEGDGFFGGYGETMGYAAASFSKTAPVYGDLVGCVNRYEVVVPEVKLGNDTSVCKNNTPYMLFAGNGYTSYTWNGDNNNYNVFPVMTSGEYTVAVVDENGCTLLDTINVTVEICVGLEEVENALQATLFPNPAVDVTSLRMIANATADVTISIMDMNGRTLQMQKQSIAMGENTIQLDVAGFAAGMYFVQVVGEQMNTVLRFVKQ